MRYGRGAGWAVALAGLSVAGLSVVGCSTVANELNSLTVFDITRSAEATVPGSGLPNLPVGALNLGGFNGLSLSDSQEFANAGVKPNNVDSVKCKTLTLSVKSGGDLSFLKSVKFVAKADGVADATIATGGPFAAGTTSASLQVSNAELKAFVTAAKMSITADVTGQPPQKDTTLTTTVTLRIDANVTGTITGK